MVDFVSNALVSNFSNDVAVFSVAGMPNGSSEECRYIPMSKPTHSVFSRNPEFQFCWCYNRHSIQFCCYCHRLISQKTASPLIDRRITQKSEQPKN